MLSVNNCLFLVIDIQEKLVKMLENDNVYKNAVKIFKAAEILKIPTIVTEQYPKGLGATLEKLRGGWCEYYEKTSFSALCENEIKEAIKNCRKKQVIICGIEAHICVLQTALELLEDGFEVFVLQDACASRKIENFKCAMKRLENSGAIVTDVETTLFELLRSSKHPNFKEIQALVK